MNSSWLRDMFCWLLLALVPAALLGANPGGGMLFGDGTAWVNGGSVPPTISVFPGDLVQTKANALHINIPGSIVMIGPESLVKYEGNELTVEHGSVTVGTVKSMKAHAGVLTIVPVSNAETQFELTDVNGTVEIGARKGNLNIVKGDKTTTLAEGQAVKKDVSEQAKNNTLAQGEQSSGDDSGKQKKKRRAGGGAVPAAAGPLLDSPYAIGAGVGATGGLLLWVLLRGDDPVSPVQP